MSGEQSPNQNVAPGRPTAVEPLPKVTKPTRKVCKSIIRMVVMSYIVGIVCIFGGQHPLAAPHQN